MTFKALFDKARDGLHYWVGAVQLDFAAEVNRVMTERDTSKADLARSLGTSAAYVTKALRGDTNFTIESMVRIARALDMDLRLHLAPKGAEVSWSTLPTETVMALHGASQPVAKSSSQDVSLRTQALDLSSFLALPLVEGGNDTPKAVNDNLAMAA
jgi:transcriptional regulator with XRE-family HTH domain